MRGQGQNHHSESLPDVIALSWLKISSLNFAVWQILSYREKVLKFVFWWFYIPVVYCCSTYEFIQWHIKMCCVLVVQCILMARRLWRKMWTEFLQTSDYTIRTEMLNFERRPHFGIHLQFHVHYLLIYYPWSVESSCRCRYLLLLVHNLKLPWHIWPNAAVLYFIIWYSFVSYCCKHVIYRFDEISF